MAVKNQSTGYNIISGKKKKKKSLPKLDVNIPKHITDRSLGVSLTEVGVGR